MRGCSKLLAALMTLLFIVVTVAAFFLFNVTRVATNREAVKAALDGEALLSEAISAVVRRSAQDAVDAQGLPAAIQQSPALLQAVENLVPAGWAATQTDAVVDAIFDYLESGDESALSLALDLSPLFAGLRGDAGRQLIAAVAQGLPACTPEQLSSLPQTGDQIPACLPPGVDPQQFVSPVHAALVATLDEQGPAGSASLIRIDLLDDANPDTADTRQALQRARRLFLFAQRWSWVVWLLPLSLLCLVLLFGARSLSGFGHWLGWSLLLAGGLTLLLALTPAVMGLFWGLLPGPAGMDGTGVMAGRVVYATFASLTDLILDRVRLQALIMAIAAVFFVAIGLVAGWMFPASGPTAPPPYR